MSNWYDQVPTFTELDATITVGRPAFVASFFAREGLIAHAQALFDAWLALLPAKSTLYYSHADTKRYIRVTPKVIAKIRDVLSPRSSYHRSTTATSTSRFRAITRSRPVQKAPSLGSASGVRSSR
jgi:hypothetical protein